MSGSDDEVFVVDSSTTESGSDNEDASAHYSTGESVTERRSEESSSLRANGAKVSHCAPQKRPVAMVNVGTETELAISPSFEAQLRQDLLRLANAVAHPLRSAANFGDGYAVHADPRVSERTKRARSPPVWAEALNSVKQLCHRRRECEYAPAAALQQDSPNPTLTGDEASAVEPPSWLPQLQTSLSSVKSDVAAAVAQQGTAGSHESGAVAHYFFSPPQTTRGDEAAVASAPRKSPVTDCPAESSTRTERRLPRDSVSAGELLTLSEASFILSREKASSLLDVYVELTRLRRQQKDSVTNAAVDTASAAAGQQTLFRLMLDRLRYGVETTSVAFRERCRSQPSDVVSVAELQAEMDAISKLRQEMDALKMGAVADEIHAPSSHAVTDDATSAFARTAHAVGYGSACAAFNEAQLAEQAELKRTIRQMASQLQEADRTIAGWQARYDAVAARLDAVEEESTKNRIRPEVFKAYRDKCRDCFANLGKLLGGEITLLTGFRVSLRLPDSYDNSAVVDLSTGEVVSGSLPVGATKRHVTQALTVPVSPTAALTAAETPTPNAPTQEPMGQAEVAPPCVPSPPPSPSLSPPTDLASAPKPQDLPPLPRSPLSPPLPAPVDSGASITEKLAFSGDAEAVAESGSAYGSRGERSTATTMPFSNDATLTNTTLATSWTDNSAVSPNNTTDPEGNESHTDLLPVPAPSNADNSEVVDSLTVAKPSAAGVFAENALWDGEDGA